MLDDSFRSHDDGVQAQQQQQPQMMRRGTHVMVSTQQPQLQQSQSQGMLVPILLYNVPPTSPLVSLSGQQSQSDFLCMSSSNLFVSPQQQQQQQQQQPQFCQPTQQIIGFVPTQMGSSLVVDSLSHSMSNGPFVDMSGMSQFSQSMSQFSQSGGSVLAPQPMVVVPTTTYAPHVQQQPMHTMHQQQQQQQQQHRQPQPQPQGNNNSGGGGARYKTSLCKSFMETTAFGTRRGSCPYGSKCLFAHGEHELRPLPRKSK